MDQVAQVREKIDLVALISEYISLKKAGHNFKANCPFHNEKSPSFVVSPERQIWHCFGCFPPGEKIKTPFGYHNIEEIDTNHWVFSGKGLLRKVTQVMQHQYDGELITVGMRKLGGNVRITSDHNVFVVRGAPYTQKKYKDFSKRFRKYLTIQTKNRERYEKLVNKYFPIKKIPAGELQKGDLLLYPIRRVEQDVKILDLTSYQTKFTNLGPIPKIIPLKISVTEDLLKLLGYYIAEGSSHRAYIRFSLGNHEEDFANEIVNLIKKVFNLDAKIYRRPDLRKTGLEITACHAKLANIFENLCGKGAGNKHIPFVLQDLPLTKQKILLDAIYKGDGTTFQANRSKNFHKSITTISMVLSEQIVDILLRLNLFPTRYISLAKTDKLLVNHKEAYSIFWSEEARQKYNLIYDLSDGTEYWLLPITNLSRKPYKGPVYNFTVDEDHSYIATNFAVANCGKGGDAFTFLMEYDHMEFPEALRTLAQKAGVELVQYKFDSGIASQKEKIYSINRSACEYYHYVLTQHPVGKHALEYLTQKRHIKPATINTYKIGFAPTDGTALTQYLLKKKFFKEELIGAGLVNDYGNRVKDFFQGRIIFPLFDHRGNNIGFSGRVLNDTDKTSKYINTRETLVYHKGSVFFGLNSSKEAIKNENRAIIMEGEFDVISCFQEGITNTVAVKGTALTEDQVSLLARFAQKITLCFDGDKAGQEAIKRSLPILEKKGLTTTVIITPDGKDPDESIKQNPVAFKIAVKNDVDIYDYLFDQAVKTYKVDSAEGKKRIGDTLLPVLHHIENEIVKEHHLRKVSRALDISYDALQREMDRLEKKEVVKKDVIVAKNSQSREEMLEDYLMSLIVQYPNPDFLAANIEEVLSLYEFQTGAYKKILDRIIAYGKAHETFDAKEFLRGLPQELMPSFDVCYLTPLTKFIDDEHYQVEVKKTAKELQSSFLRSKIKELGEQIEEKEKTGKDEEVVKLQRQLQKFVSLLHVE